MKNAHNKQCEKHTKHGAGANTAAHALHIARTIALPCYHSTAIGQANREHHRHHKKRRHRTHRCQRLYTNGAANNDHVSNIIKLLKNITNEQRYHKGQDKL